MLGGLELGGTVTPTSVEQSVRISASRLWLNPNRSNTSFILVTVAKEGEKVGGTSGVEDLCRSRGDSDGLEERSTVSEGPSDGDRLQSAGDGDKEDDRDRLEEAEDRDEQWVNDRGGDVGDGDEEEDGDRLEKAGDGVKEDGDVQL